MKSNSISDDASPTTTFTKHLAVSAVRVLMDEGVVPTSWARSRPLGHSRRRSLGEKNEQRNVAR